MSTPALLRLRESAPDSQITLLAREKLAGLWNHHPGIDRVLTFAEAACGTRPPSASRTIGLSLILPSSVRSALEQAGRNSTTRRIRRQLANSL
jgi:ADP-heptose:LPS heptosyltransferase